MTADGYRWDDYREEERLHAKLPLHRRRVARAQDIARDWIQRCERPYIALSGGKDSTAMAHLIQSVASEPLPVMWHDSGVEWPGVERVIERLQEIGVVHELVVVRPDVDVVALKRRQSAGEISAEEKDRIALFQPIEEAIAAHGFDGVALGLRKGESRGRLLDRVTRGPVHQRRDGLIRCTPLADWCWRDVFAYIASHRLPLHPIYSAPLHQLEHRGRIRLSWWLSSDHYRHGEMRWVRQVYPELHQQIIDAMPEVEPYA